MGHLDSACDSRGTARSPDESPTARPSTDSDVYGFLGWITSSVFYCMFIVWSCVPDGLIQWHGVTYYPSKYWAVAVPTWACVTIVTIIVLYESMNAAHGHALMEKKKREQAMLDAQERPGTVECQDDRKRRTGEKETMGNIDPSSINRSIDQSIACK
jgi:uncharacterized membrane protein